MQYLFATPAELPDAEGTAVTGLVRRELNWESSNPPTQNRDDWRRPATRRPSTRNSADPLDGAADDLDPSDDTLLRVPEVTGLEFRYYDGRGWSGQWNSLTQKSLPVAVEVNLTVQLAAAGQSPRHPQHPPRKPNGRRLRILRAGQLSRRAPGRRPAGCWCSCRAPPWRRAAEPPPADGLWLPARPAIPPRPVFVPPSLPAPPARPTPPGGSPEDALQAVMQDQWMRNGS